MTLIKIGLIGQANLRSFGLYVVMYKVMLTRVYQDLRIVLLSRNFRLESHDGFKNFREDPIIIPEPLDVFWPITGFQQLAPEHKPMPQLTYLQIEQYFLSRMAGEYVNEIFNQDLTEMFLFTVIF